MRKRHASTSSSPRCLASFVASMPPRQPVGRRRRAILARAARRDAPPLIPV
ncbi:uncharacterized protein BCN122_II1632 [Burkholderia cenocepacia]|nr:uncharacterized protein BCN122_II1632 [Burkholderia cenocepacia]